jgi:tRNA modification GTPase
MIRKDETICALASAPGGAISLIRVSGPDCLGICEKIILPSNKDLYLKEQNGFTIIHGNICDDKEVIDEVLVNIYKAPHSYTGEDSVEI